jgi:[ribosomal protein S5]-alanine N-acetyltransferase
VKCQPIKATAPIGTARLLLKAPTMADLAGVQATWNLDGEPISPLEAAAEIESMLSNRERNNSGTFVHLCLAIVDKESGRFIGWCGLDQRDPRKPCPVLFYLLERAYWGRGLATEAATELLRFAFDELGLVRVDGSCAPENAASRRVMEKLGMRYVGLDNEGGHSFALVRADYVRCAKGLGGR